MSKTVDEVKHSYIYAGGKLLRETYGNTVLDFFYDSNGMPYALKYNGTVYYYITNLQGDVMKLVDASGTVVASYEYDPYGNITSSSGDMAAINPLRYRGYYYDSDSGLYYLQSRYYDPKVGRFINADSYASTGHGVLGNNMFAYCNNNPASFEDSSGYSLKPSTVSINDTGRGDFIYNQEDDPYGSVSLGLASVAHGGCGPVAVYNVLRMMGNFDIEFSEIVEYFIINGYTNCGGILGTSYDGCIAFLRDQGYTVYATKKVREYAELAATADACILNYWFDSSTFVQLGAHFTAFEQCGKTGFYYNAYNNIKTVYKFNGDCADFVAKNEGCIPVLILIYDV